MKNNQVNKINWWLIIGIVVAVAFVIVVSIVASLVTVGFTGNVVKVTAVTNGTEVYSKAEIDTKISNLQSQINSCCQSPPPVQKGSLSITSSPTGANIYVDGVSRGYAPVKVENLSVGDHTVKAVKSGYVTSQVTKYVAAGSNILEITLSTIPPTKATVSVRSSPTGAYLFLNGNNKGQTPLTLTLTPGTYEFKVKQIGYNDYVVKKYVAAGNTDINAVLTRIP